MLHNIDWLIRFALLAEDRLVFKKSGVSFSSDVYYFYFFDYGGVEIKDNNTEDVSL